MSNALANVPDPNQQPRWLLALPENLRSELTNLSPKEQKAAARLKPEAFAGLTVEEARELITETAGNMQSDEATPYIPEVIEIVHTAQVFKDASGLLGETLEGIPVHHHPTRATWQVGEKLPLCSSLDGVTGRAAPDAGPDFPWAINPQGVRPCKGCPWDEFGTGTDDKGNPNESKRCKEKERIFLLTDDRALPVLVHVPPKSLNNWRQWVSGVRNRKATPSTRWYRLKLSLAKEEKPGQVFSVIKFNAVKVLDPQTFLEVSRMSKSIVEAAKKLGVEIGEHYEEAKSGDQPQGDVTDIM